MSYYAMWLVHTYTLVCQEHVGPGALWQRGMKCYVPVGYTRLNLFLSAVPSPFLDVPSSSPTHPVMIGYFILILVGDSNNPRNLPTIRSQCNQTFNCSITGPRVATVVVVIQENKNKSEKPTLV